LHYPNNYLNLPASNTKSGGKVITEKINYIHNNPVEEGLVFRPEDYVFSIARDYSAEHGLPDKVIVVDLV